MSCSHPTRPQAIGLASISTWVHVPCAFIRPHSRCFLSAPTPPPSPRPKFWMAGVVYTFDFYQHLYNAVTFELDLGFRRVKLADYLNHQPAQVMNQQERKVQNRRGTAVEHSHAHTHTQHTKQKGDILLKPECTIRDICHLLCRDIFGEATALPRDEPAVSRDDPPTLPRCGTCLSF